MDRFKFSRSALVENCGGKSINLSVLVNICGGKIVQHVISYNNENENVKIQNRIERVQHKLNTKTILYRITNVHAQSLSLTCRAGIRCTQEIILALNSFLKRSDQTVQLQWLFSPSVSQ